MAYTDTILSAPKNKIKFKQVNDDTISNITASSLNASSYSVLNELYDEKNTIQKYSTCEPNRHKLDGSYKLIDENDLNIGISGLGNEVNANLTYTDKPTFIYSFTSLVSSLFTVVFDINELEYATEFDIIAYDSDVEIDRIEVRDNTDLIYISDVGIFNYDKIELVILKWSKEDRRARVSEFYPGIIMVLDNSLLGDITYNSYYSPTSLTVSSDTITFKFSDIDNRYNPFLKNSWYYFLQFNQKIEYELSIENDVYTKMGTFYLNQWISKEQVVSLAGVNILGTVENPITYSGNKTLLQHAIDILDILGITNYTLDPKLANYTVNVSVENVNGKELLRNLAIGGMCALYSNRNGDTFIQEPSEIYEDRFNLTYDTADKPGMALEQITRNLIFSINGTDYIKQINTNGEDIKIDTTFIGSDAQAIAVKNYLEPYLNNRTTLSYLVRPYPPLASGDYSDTESQFESAPTCRLMKQYINCSAGGMTGEYIFKVVNDNVD